MVEDLKFQGLGFYGPRFTGQAGDRDFQNVRTGWKSIWKMKLRLRNWSKGVLEG